MPFNIIPTQKFIHSQISFERKTCLQVISMRSFGFLATIRVYKIWGNEGSCYKVLLKQN